jgi:alkylation response protein AidB-like acyl-CoA dehydrogenase
MGNFYTDNADLQFHIERSIDWRPLVELTEDKFRQADGHENLEDALDFYKEVLQMVGQFVADEIAPRVPAIDKNKPELVDGEVQHPKEFMQIFDQIKALELHGLGFPRELGGMNAPHIITMACAEMFARADVSVMTHHSFHFGIGMALLVYSMSEGTTEFKDGQILKTRFDAEIREMMTGNAWGAMDITEPDAGSDMGALRTRAEQDDAGNWFLTGQKIFITSGHAKYHIVIARTEAPDDKKMGLNGLSTFLVPAYEDHADGTRIRFATIDRLEEKLGHHGSPTCSISFENAPAQLIGERGDGFRQMLLLMNNARIGVGFEGVALCEASTRLAREYAAERKAFGKTIDRHEMIADYLDEMESTTAGLRSLGFASAFNEEMAFRIGIHLRRNTALSESEIKSLRNDEARHKALSRRFTPLFKYLSSEAAVEFAQRCVQIHGGVGYTKEYGAEKLLRDAMVMPIYEGTSQIQALMVMKDTLAITMKAPQDFVKSLAQARWKAASVRDPLARRVARIEVMALQAQQHLIQKTVVDKFKTVKGLPVSDWVKLVKTDWDPKRDFAFAMLHAERLTKILADQAIAEILLAESEQHPERRDLLERFTERAEVRCASLLNEITTTGDRMLKKLQDAAV